MATWEKTGTAWFGDTFNRDMALCNAEIAYDAALDSDCTSVKAINWNGSDSATATLTCNTVAIDQNRLEGACSGYTINANVDIISNRFNELQAQINDLKKKLETKKENSELRSALKTLHYKREVE